MASTDLDAERAFYRDRWGLREVGAAGWTGAGSRPRATRNTYVVRLRAAAANRVDVIALAAGSRADVDALHAQRAGRRLPRDLSRRARCTSPGGGYGFRFFSPDGLPFEISCDVARGAARDDRALGRRAGAASATSCCTRRTTRRR